MRHGDRLSQENIIAYLNHFQSREPLTIGELWALPLMLRFKLIENVQCLAIDIDRRLSEGEQASFWGNRLRTVARREPGRLQQFLDDLAEQQPLPTSHFAEELIDHLYDEESILPVVKKWLEGKIPGPIADIIQQEQKQQTAEQDRLFECDHQSHYLFQIIMERHFRDCQPCRRHFKCGPQRSLRANGFCHARPVSPFR